jgi:YidC/Oxa1 family membrane protein insertase
MLLIPILSALLQFLQTKLSMAVQKSGDDKKKNATPGAMEGMLKIMPIISGIFCVIFPIGVGLYWVINSAVSIVQQYFINKRLDKISIDDIVAANEAKEAERMKKLGIVSNSNTTSNIARTNTKTISAIAANNNSSNKGKNSDDRKPSQKISDRKKDELSKNAAEGKSNISAIANLFRGDDEEDK